MGPLNKTQDREKAGPLHLDENIPRYELVWSPWLVSFSKAFHFSRCSCGEDFLEGIITGEWQPFRVDKELWNEWPEMKCCLWKNVRNFDHKPHVQWLLIVHYMLHKQLLVRAQATVWEGLLTRLDAACALVLILLCSVSGFKIQFLSQQSAWNACRSSWCFVCLFVYQTGLIFRIKNLPVPSLAWLLDRRSCSHESWWEIRKNIGKKIKEIVHYALHIVGFGKSRRDMNQISVLRFSRPLKLLPASLQHYEANIVIRSIIARFSLLCHKFILISEGRGVLVCK